MLGYFELKYAKDELFYYDSFEPHQISSLLALQDNGLIWKISDTDPRLKPCDSFSVPPLTAYVVIKYPKAFVMITVNNFIHARDRSKRKSLTYEQALEIATKVIHT
jgi:hypothetical protein